MSAQAAGTLKAETSVTKVIGSQPVTIHSAARVDIDQETQWRMIAYHEAGHAAMAILQGIEMKFVEIVCEDGLMRGLTCSGLPATYEIAMINLSAGMAAEQLQFGFYN